MGSWSDWATPWQGCVLGLILYILYTSGLASLVAAQCAHKVLGQQLCRRRTGMRPLPFSNAIPAVRVTIPWNRLRLNPPKAKFIWLCTRQQFAKLSLSALASEFPDYAFSTDVSDIGVWLDQKFTFAPPIHRLTRDRYYHLRHLRTVTPSLTPCLTATMAHSFSTARLDYCFTI